MIKIWGVKII